MRLQCAFLLMSFSTPALAAKCSVEHYRFVWGSDTSTHMTVKTGSVCRLSIGNRTFVRSASVAQPAGSGVVTEVDNNNWIYKPRAGFSGKDAFVVLVSGQGTRGAHLYDGESRISVDVDVTP